MHDRIEELAYEAEEYADMKSDEGADFHPAYTERLSTLVIQECLEVLTKRIVGDHNREEQEVQRCIEAVKQHFGVK